MTTQKTRTSCGPWPIRAIVCLLSSATLLAGPVGSATQPAETTVPPAPVTAITPPTAPAMQPDVAQVIRTYLPDPAEAAEVYQERTKRYSDPELRADFENLVKGTKDYKGALDYIRQFQEGDLVRLSLHDCIRRALEHSYAIDVAGYNPAIEAARVVEAEARFDVVFFGNYQDTIQDKPNAPSTLSQLQNIANLSQEPQDGTAGLSSNVLSLLSPTARGTQSRNSSYQFGLRKPLSTGAQVRTGYEFNRGWTSQPFTTFNPSYADDVFFEIRQPFLRGFGLDVTKAEIHLRKLDREMAEQRYVRQVQRTVQQVEQAYWQLVSARRSLPITAELLAQTEQVLHYFTIRARFDVQPVQLANTRARRESRQAELIAVVNRIRDAEAQLKALINDPRLPTPAETRIVPTDLPAIDAVLLSRLAELKTAMDNRPELAEAKYGVQSARVGVTVANNQRLPRLDVSFRYTVQGLGSNLDAAFEQVTTNDFVDYLIGVEFEWPIGNRGAEAAHRQARLRMAQAIAAVKQLVEQVILEVDVAFRNLGTLFEEIAPSARAVEAQADNLGAIQQRADRKDPTFLDMELNTQEALAAARRNLLSVWTQYSISLANLELAKGTLLRYNNIHLEPRGWAPSESAAP